MTHTNDDKAAQARAAIDRYAEVAYPGYDRGSRGGEEAPEVVSDLLSDLRHFCDAYGVDFDARADHAEDNYRAETAGDAFDPGQAKASPAEPTTWPQPAGLLLILTADDADLVHDTLARHFDGDDEEAARLAALFSPPLDRAAFHSDVLDRAQQNQLADAGYYDDAEEEGIGAVGEWPNLGGGVMG